MREHCCGAGSQHEGWVPCTASVQCLAHNHTWSPAPTTAGSAGYCRAWGGLCHGPGRAASGCPGIRCTGGSPASGPSPPRRRAARGGPCPRSPLSRPRPPAPRGGGRTAPSTAAGARGAAAGALRSARAPLGAGARAGGFCCGTS